jgi:endonuclease/exonuclease/phosphatase family metal-dependent hydrolase
LILAQIEKMNTDFLPVILMGDFNATPEESPIRLISQQLTDAGNSLPIAQGRPTGTFNGFRGNAEQRRIDYIFVSGLQVESYLHLDARTESNRNLSDHLPVVGTFSVP